MLQRLQSCVLLAAIGWPLTSAADDARPGKGIYKLRAEVQARSTASDLAGGRLPSCGADGRQYLQSKETLHVIVNTTSVVNGRAWRVVQDTDNELILADPEATPQVDMFVSLRRNGSTAVAFVAFRRVRDGKLTCVDVKRLVGSFESN